MGKMVILTTNNATHRAMEHILTTEGFKEQSDGVEWVKELPEA